MNRSLIRILQLSVCSLLLACSSSLPPYAANDALLNKMEAQARQPASEVIAQPADSLNLEQLLLLAAENHPSLKDAFYQWKSSMAQVVEAKSLPDPQLTYAHFIRQVETRMSSQEQRISLAQTIPWPGTLGLRGELAAQSAHQAYYRLDAQRRQLFYEVESAYYDYALLQRSRGILRKNINLLESLENVVRTKYSAGIAPYSSLIKIQVERDRLINQLASIEDSFLPLQTRINGALNRPYGTPLRLRIEMPHDTLGTTFFDAAEAGLLRHHPVLKIDSLARNKQHLAKGLAGKSYYPDIMLSVDYIRTGEALNPQMAESGKDPLVAMISVNLPIWWGKKNAAVRAAQAAFIAADQQLAASRISLQSDLATVHFRYRDALRQLQLYTDLLLPRAEQAFVVAQTAYQAGSIDILNLIDAQRTLLEFQLAVERAAATYRQRLAQLNMMTAKSFYPEGNK